MLDRKERDFKRDETKQGEKEEKLIENSENKMCLRREKWAKKGIGGRKEDRRGEG